MANVNYAQTKYNYDGAYLTGIQGTATGTIVPWSTATAPTGFLKCDGAAVSRTTYADLFAVVGTTYGVGDGSTTFNLPDLQDRTVVASSNTKSLAQTGGANTVASTGNIGGSVAATTLTTSQIPSHSHTAPQYYNPYLGDTGSTGFRDIGPYQQSQFNATQTTGGGQSHTHNLSANFVGDATSVLQPYLVLIYIIKT